MRFRSLLAPEQVAPKSQVPLRSGELFTLEQTRTWHHRRVLLIFSDPTGELAQLAGTEQAGTG
jgi:hypothetical protein